MNTISNSFSKISDITKNMIGGLIKKSNETNLTTGSLTNGNNVLSFFLDNTGNVIGSARSKSFQEEIRTNATIRTILNKQINIAMQTELKIYETKAGKDDETTNEYAKNLLENFLSPNTYPAFTTWNDIVKYFVESYYIDGVGALVLTFKDTFDTTAFMVDYSSYISDNRIAQAKEENAKIKDSNSLQYIQPAKSVSYFSNNISSGFKMQLNDSIGDVEFKQNINMGGLYTASNSGKFYIAIVFGNFDFKSCQYKPFVEPIKNLILLDNAPIEAMQSFYQNSCVPSSIITLTPNTKNAEIEMQILNDATSNEGSAKYKELVTEIKAKIKGSSKTGEILISNDMRFKYDVIPLQIMPDGKNAIDLSNTARERIYTFFGLGSQIAYEGKTEYANNAERKIKELFDAVIDNINSKLIENLTQFMRVYLKQFGYAKPLDVKNLYFSLNTSHISFYKEYKATDALDMFSKGLIEQNEARKIISTLNEVDYGNLVDLPNGDRTFQELSRTQNSNLIP
jgi:hypothetical protein